MSLGEISELSQAVASLATGVGLGFVAIQIRQNTRATKAASHDGVSDPLHEINRMFAENADLTRIWASGQQDRG
jgi:hypothetical protein